MMRAGLSRRRDQVTRTFTHLDPCFLTVHGEHLWRGQCFRIGRCLKSLDQRVEIGSVDSEQKRRDGCWH